MAITVYADVIAPNSLWSATVSGKQRRSNNRGIVASGKMQINVGWTRTMRQYSFGTVPLTVSQWQALEALYEVTDAGAFGFLVQDPKDCSADHTTGKVTATGVGSPSTNTYQLNKTTTSVGSSRTYVRTITRPRAASFILHISGVPTLSYTLDADTGVVTIPSGPAAGVVTWAGIYYIPVHFQSDDLDWDLVAAGAADARLMVGPTVILDEIKEG
jgi:uncharacterized protein (TIGR02217 family)